MCMWLEMYFHGHTLWFQSCDLKCAYVGLSLCVYMSVCTHMCSRGLLSLAQGCVDKSYFWPRVILSSSRRGGRGHAWLEATLTSLPLSVLYLCPAPLPTLASITAEKKVPKSSAG